MKILQKPSCCIVQGQKRPMGRWIAVWSYYYNVSNAILHKKLLCSRDVAIPVQSRICFLKFHDRESVAVAQHLTNTVFIDRALIIIPFTTGDMPDEQRAMEILGAGGTIPGIGQEAKWPAHITNQVGCDFLIWHVFLIWGNHILFMYIIERSKPIDFFIRHAKPFLKSWYDSYIQFIYEKVIFISLNVIKRSTTINSIVIHAKPSLKE